MKSVLIVDDIPKNIQLLATLLKENGYEIAFAQDGYKALEALATNTYDLILLDIMMPGIDGFETCIRIKEINEYKDIPIIFLTGKDSNEDIIKGFELGGADYVTKPFNQAELLSRIKTHIALKSLTDNLKDEVAREVKERQKQDELLIEQGKMAAVGEMIEEIAHQWRQPLNALSMMIQNLKYQKMAGILDDETLNSTVEDGVKTTKFLSQTIDDFRDFFKQTKNQESFRYLEAVEDVLKIIGMNLKNKGIEVEIDINSGAKLYGVKSEFLQVLLNLLNNAKDALVESDSQHRKIVISLEKKENQELLSISDNAGGIDESILDKLFESRVSTKLQKDGSGIGLYISNRIIKEHFRGELIVENTSNGTTKGAKFTIVTMPIVEKE